MECHIDSLHPGESDKEATEEITLLDGDIKMADNFPTTDLKSVHFTLNV